MTAKTLPKRDEVPEELTWDLSTIYADEADWEKDFAEAESLLPKLESYKGRIKRSGRIMLEYFELSDTVSQLIGKLFTYAHLRADQDTGNTHYQGLQERCKELSVKAGAARSWENPEILSIKDERLDQFYEKNDGLELYRQQIDELRRERDHIRSAEVEELLSEAGKVHAGPRTSYTMFANADLKLPEVADETGTEVRLTAGNWSTFLDNKDRSVRQAAYQAMFGTWGSFRNMLAATYDSQVKVNLFRAKARRYDSPLAMALQGINVPTSVYDTLIDTVHANFDKLQRYLEMRKRLLGLNELRWYDLYVPLVGEVDWKVTYPEAQEMVLAAVAPLGDEYVAALRNGFASRWVDVAENEGKRSGAYSSGTWGTNPFILMNWQDSVDSMYTLAHEAGHSMHSWFTRKTQPYPYAGYTIFVAEVASTCNEALLTHHLLSVTDDPARRRYIINKQLERFRATLYRQTMFAEFEKIAHEKAQAGKPLTPDALCEIHQGLNEKYLGPAVVLDDRIGIEWARIPHFYRSFYVYQYATGISAATALASQIVSEGEPAVERYLRFLSRGSSDYSINLLADAGVDLSTAEPIQQALDAFDAYIDQFEEVS